MKQVIRIIAAVVDTSNLTLYKEDGETVIISQGNSRVRSIIDTATPQLIAKGYADVDVSEVADTTYIEFEEKSNGVVKLFRIAKDKIAALFAGMAEEVVQSEPVEPTILGELPIQTRSALNAVKEIMQHAVPVSSPSFNEVGIEEQGNIVEDDGHTIKHHGPNMTTDTIVAVVDGKIIPGIEKIKTQFKRATETSSTKGIEAFLRRLGSVINEHKHSVEDLLKFMERGDLPIADDGSILIYKVLNQKGDKYVDCHTGKVEQWVGAYVCMDHTLVDHNRNNECSNGLHVARRGYISNFSGNVCVLAKLAPEDVIAVPSYDANKMRVCGYHIVAELSQAQHMLLKANQPITNDPAGKILLGKVLSGDHIQKTHEVRITGSLGTNVKVTKYEEVTQPVPETNIKAPVAEALENPVSVKMDTPINPKDVVKEVEKLSRQDIAIKLFNEGKYDELKAYKKAAKVSWEKLGIMVDPDNWPPVVVQAKPVSKVVELTSITHGEGSYQERIHKLLAIGLTSPGVAQAILDLKRKAKKSWIALGIQHAVEVEILKLTNS